MRVLSLVSLENSTNLFPKNCPMRIDYTCICDLACAHQANNVFQIAIAGYFSLVPTTNDCQYLIPRSLLAPCMGCGGCEGRSPSFALSLLAVKRQGFLPPRHFTNPSTKQWRTNSLMHAQFNCPISCRIWFSRYCLVDYHVRLDQCVLIRSLAIAFKYIEYIHPGLYFLRAPSFTCHLHVSKSFSTNNVANFKAFIPVSSQSSSSNVS